MLPAESASSTDLAARAIEQSAARLRRLAQASELPPSDSGCSQEELVHELRKELKTLRALNELFRFSCSSGEHQARDQNLRDAGRALASLRRSAALEECLHRLAEQDGLPRAACQVVQEQLAAERAQEGQVDALAVLREHVARYVLPPGVGLAGLRRALAKRQRKFEKQRRLCLATPTDESLHGLRKQAKALRTQLRAVRPGCGEIQRLGELSSVLGELHDLADLDEWFRAPPARQAGPRLAVQQAAGAARQRLEQEALRLAQDVRGRFDDRQLR